MSEVNLPLRFAFWEESDKTTHFFVHVSLLILCWEGIAEQFGQVAPTNLGSFSDYKLSGNDYTNKKTSNLLDNHKPSKKNQSTLFQSHNSPKKFDCTCLEYIVGLRCICVLHFTRLVQNLHSCFTTSRALHRSLGSCRLCISCQYSVTTNTLLPSLAIKPWGWP